MSERKKAPVTVTLSVLPDVYLEVATAEDLSRKKQKLTRATYRLLTDKPLRRELRRTAAPVAAMAAGSAIAALNRAVPKRKIVKKRGEALDTYTELVSSFAAVRKKYKDRRLRAAKRQGYDEKTGLYYPKKLKKLSKMSKLPKAEKLSTLSKAARLPRATREPKAQRYKIYKKKK